MTPEDLAAAIRDCPSCTITAPGQPITALCTVHRRAVEAMFPEPCPDDGCTACRP